MDIVTFEFSPEQRRLLDRYARFLDTLFPTYDNIPIVFDRRKNSGHQRAELTYDTRLNKVLFNQKYLRDYWDRSESARIRCDANFQDLLTFTRESLEITRQTSPSKPLDEVDVNLYSFSRSPSWGSVPTSVRGLVQGLGSQFFDTEGHIDVLKFIDQSLYEDAFALRSAFMGAMDYRSCNCHLQPTVVEALFRETDTTPVWDVAYSSTDPSIKSAEYKADVTALFNGFTSLRSQMGFFVAEILLRVDSAKDELFQTADMSTMGRLNSKLERVVQEAEEFMTMINHLEAWLRK
ncbi:hypothetical protein [Pseudomonas sp. BGI-2]|uniref:hypothetical protein n=1 Tax=Pseudomonas sp. BGI-2 TaxID=2528211 RepID=UPI001034B8EE|nr:hypothetical protein [Pseudomonas sp. BGI-2]TBN34984.1 hypothetical protein EYC95_26545 [Pseudomonas sp. BGI-2]